MIPRIISNIFFILTSYARRVTELTKKQTRSAINAQCNDNNRHNKNTYHNFLSHQHVADAFTLRFRNPCKARESGSFGFTPSLRWLSLPWCHNDVAYF